MIRTIVCGLILVIAGCSSTPEATAPTPEPLHLFILSGQSNMAGLDPSRTFTPAVEAAFGADRVIVVKDAMGGQPIRRWYKRWEPRPSDKPEQIGDLYDRLLAKVAAAVGERKPTTVTFVWMQGERDAREKLADRYADAFNGLLAQLREDLGHDDINYVIGRLSDFDNDNKRYPHWTRVRQIHAALADASPRGAWVDTDDLNGPKDDLHYTRPEGYDEMGKRFAAEAIGLVRRDSR